MVVCIYLWSGKYIFVLQFWYTVKKIENKDNLFLNQTVGKDSVGMDIHTVKHRFRSDWILATDGLGEGALICYPEDPDLHKSDIMSFTRIECTGWDAALIWW